MATKVPGYSYNGTHSSEVKDGYWYIYLKSDGTLNFTYAQSGIQACIVGGGGGGEAYNVALDRGGHGGGGGAVSNKTGISIAAGTGYPITIGAGGAVGGDGKASSAFGYTASGGSCAGGNCGLSIEDKAGTDGGNGTYAFGDTSLARYGAGGGGGGSNDVAMPGNGGSTGGGKGGYGAAFSAGTAAVAGMVNTGGGGGGAGQDNNWTDDDGHQWASGGAAAEGGSGIVILRGTQDDELPVCFDNKQLSEIYFNGEKVTGLIYGGTRLFVRRVKEWLSKCMARRFEFRRAIPAL